MRIKTIIALFLMILLLPAAIVTMKESQDTPAPLLEITGVDASNLPTAIITANVFDQFNLPVLGLTAEDFALSGELAEVGSIVSVENVTDNVIPFASVLVIDTSSSMAGRPFEAALEAATLFVEGLAEDDLVAIYTFDTTVSLRLDFTADKDVILNTIATLPFGGQTALYDAGVAGVRKAAEAPTNRRAVILLSDGQEFGGLSQFGRDDALAEAQRLGVSVYTIGLGFGIDRSYLQNLSSGTNALNYETPNPDDLPGIYTELVNRLRTQYVITLDVDVPLDGTVYGLTLQADTPDGATNEASTTLRAPIPIPIVTVPDAPTAAITEPTDFTVNVAADEPLESVTAQLDGAEVQTLTAEPFTVTINPVDFAPGDYTLTFTATDVDGDSGSASVDFEIAALPSNVIVLPDLTGEVISELTSITVDATGQTATESVTLTIGDATATLDQAPFSFTIDPMALPPGDTLLTVDVVNAGGATATVTQEVTIAVLSPQVSISGLESDQLIEVTAPVIDQTLDFSVDIERSQTAITEVVALIDGQEIARIDEAPFNFALPLAEFDQGSRTLEIVVTNESEGTTTLNVPFLYSIFVPPTPTSTPTLTPTLTPTVDLQATADAEATSEALALAQATSDAQATLDAEDEAAAAAAQATADAEATIDAEEADAEDEAAAAAAQATADAEATIDAEEADAEATREADEAAAAAAQATIDAEEAAAAQATADAEATVEAQEEATREAEVAAIAQATIDAEATSAAIELATADAIATQDAQATAQAEEQATADAIATADAEATAQAEEQATADAQATIDAEEAAFVQATADAEATVNAEATADAIATADAEATADAQATVDAIATADAQATITVEAAAAALTGTPPAEEPTAVAQVPTDEPEDTPEPTEIDATATPPGPLTEIDAPGAEDDTTDLLPFIIGGGLLLLLLLLFLFMRRRGQAAT